MLLKGYCPPIALWFNQICSGFFFISYSICKKKNGRDQGNFLRKLPNLHRTCWMRYCPLITRLIQSYVVFLTMWRCRKKNERKRCFTVQTLKVVSNGAKALGLWYQTEKSQSFVVSSRWFAAGLTKVTSKVWFRFLRLQFCFAQRGSWLMIALVLVCRQADLVQQRV